MPPLWLISTSPEIFLTLQVPQRPNSQAAEMRTPPARAVCRMVWPARHSPSTPTSEKRIGSAAPRPPVPAPASAARPGRLDGRRGEALLVIALHVEAGRFQHAAHGPHERIGPAAEDLALQEVGRQQRQPDRVDAAHMAGPAFAGRALLDEEAERQAGHVLPAVRAPCGR